MKTNNGHHPENLGPASTAPATGPPPGGPATTPGTSRDGSPSDLHSRRLELAAQVAKLTWDLGGLTYEMARRDHYRLDVLSRRAAELQHADAQLGELERLLAAHHAGIHGHCHSCGAVHSRGAAFCWQCGIALLEETRPASFEQR